MKMRRIVLVENEVEGSVFGLDTEFLPGEEPTEEMTSEFSSDFDNTTQEVSHHGK
jgi:hypothetical protein